MNYNKEIGHLQALELAKDRPLGNSRMPAILWGYIRLRDSRVPKVKTLRLTQDFHIPKWVTTGLHNGPTQKFEGLLSSYKYPDQEAESRLLVLIAYVP